MLSFGFKKNINNRCEIPHRSRLCCYRRRRQNAINLLPSSTTTTTEEEEEYDYGIGNVNNVNVNTTDLGMLVTTKMETSSYIQRNDLSVYQFDSWEEYFNSFISSFTYNHCGTTTCDCTYDDDN